MRWKRSPNSEGKMLARSKFRLIFSQCDVLKQVSNRKRMLKLELTDGHGTVIAMECSPIPCLNTKLVPGTKILIKGKHRIL